MSYTGNPRIDAALLVAINDGSGDQCGSSYQDRLRVARWSRAALWPWRMMLRRAAKAAEVSLSPEERLQGAEYLRQYYIDHISEGA